MLYLGVNCNFGVYIVINYSHYISQSFLKLCFSLCCRQKSSFKSWYISLFRCYWFVYYLSCFGKISFAVAEISSLREMIYSLRCKYSVMFHLGTYEVSFFFCYRRKTHLSSFGDITSAVRY